MRNITMVNARLVNTIINQWHMPNNDVRRLIEDTGLGGRGIGGDAGARRFALHGYEGPDLEGLATATTSHHEIFRQSNNNVQSSDTCGV